MMTQSVSSVACGAAVTTVTRLEHDASFKARGPSFFSKVSLLVICCVLITTQAV